MAFSTSILYEIEESRRQEREKSRCELLKKTIDEAKRIFHTTGVQDVYITGSLLLPDRFNKYSDIDIAVKGIPDHSYFSILAQLEDSLTRNVEIIDLEHCRFVKHIIDTGLKII